MAKFLVSVRLLGIVSTTVLKFVALFFALEAGAYAQNSVSIRLLVIVSTVVLKFVSHFPL